METLIIGIITVGALLMLLVAIGRNTSRQVENQDEILSKIEQERKRKQQTPKDDCMNPLIYPVCSCCKFASACDVN